MRHLISCAPLFLVAAFLPLATGCGGGSATAGGALGAQDPAAPDSAAEYFDLRVPRTLPESGFQGTRSQRMPDPSQGTLLSWGGPNRPEIRVRVSPIVHPPLERNAPVPDSLRARRLAEEGAYELEAFGRTFAQQNVRVLNPDAAWEERVFETQYGPAMGRHLSRNIEFPDGTGLRLLIYIFSMEHAIVRAVSFVEAARGAGWENHVEMFADELARTILVTRLPPGGG